MGRKKSTKKSPVKITDRVAKRIVAVALEHPNLGPGRLAPLLAQEKIALTPSRIYSVLRSQGLQTREKRLERIEARKRKPAAAGKKPASRTPPEIEQRLVAISLKHPDLGARGLLPLLNKEGIDLPSSTVYAILKRNELENRAKRLAAIGMLLEAETAPVPSKEAEGITIEEEETGAAVASETASEYDSFIAEQWPLQEGMDFPSSDELDLTEGDGLPIDVASAAPLPAQEPWIPYEEPLAVPPEAEAPSPSLTTAPTEATHPRRELAVAGVHEIVSGKARWLLHLINLLLLVLLGYMGFLTVQNLRQALAEPAALSFPEPSPAPSASPAKPGAQKPLNAYSRIWERNLFNVKATDTQAQEVEVPVEQIAPAKKDIGLKLVGTVVTHDASLNLAILQVQKLQREEAYREGERADAVQIKKILRNRVIITTAEGDQLLTVEPEDYAKRRSSSPPAGTATRSALPAQQTAGAASLSPGQGISSAPVRKRSITLKREDVEASLTDVDQWLQELQISPFLQDDQPAGFVISKIPRRSILTRMGLRNGYAVTQLNGQPITSPDQAAEFFRALASGDEVNFQITRSRGVRRRDAQIQLNIR